MDQQIEQQLRQNWKQARQQILETFTQVAQADVDPANSAEDLVRRIAAKANYPERYVETKLTELVGSGGGRQSSSFGTTSQQSGFSSSNS